MLKLIDLTYHVNTEYRTPVELFQAQKESFGYAKFLRDKVQVTVVKHMPTAYSITIDGVQYHFFRRPMRYFKFPFKTLLFIKRSRPDLVLVQGFIFPLQVVLLRLLLGKRCRLILQHHGEHPSSGHTVRVLKAINNIVDAYLFTSLGNCKPWLQKNIISQPEKCYELQAASTGFVRQDKQQCMFRFGMSGNKNFIWVGRLNSNKDPLTVLAGFENYISIYPDAKLYMIFQTEELLTEVTHMLSRSKSLKHHVILKGKIDHEDLVYWYSASDFYISGSHAESCGYALIEAMACGCIPVVTNIPSFRKITNNGEFGVLYEAGEVKSLINALNTLDPATPNLHSDSIIAHFERSLSFKSIADQLHSLCLKLTRA